jgi:prepilin-type N-terminal cleavage/methylation domain-containing protein
MRNNGIINLNKLSKKSHCNRGFTLVEAVVSLALVAIIILVISTLFFSISTISKLSEQQIERTTIIRIVKENVTKSVRDNTEILGTTQIASDAPLYDVKIEDLSGQKYPEYTFDLLKNSETDGVYQYKVTLKKERTNPFEYLFEIYP